MRDFNLKMIIAQKRLNEEFRDIRGFFTLNDVMFQKLDAFIFSKSWIEEVKKNTKDRERLVLDEPKVYEETTKILQKFANHLNVGGVNK